MSNQNHVEVYFGTQKLHCCTANSRSHLQPSFLNVFFSAHRSTDPRNDYRVLCVFQNPTTTQSGRETISQTTNASLLKSVDDDTSKWRVRTLSRDSFPQRGASDADMFLQLGLPKTALPFRLHSRCCPRAQQVKYQSPTTKRCSDC
jgi:hypothetical protein